MVRGLKFRIYEEKGLYYLFTMQLICDCIFTNAKRRFSHDKALIARSLLV